MLKLILLSALCATVFGAPQVVQWMDIKPANQVVEKPVESTHPLFESPYKHDWYEFKALFKKEYNSIKEELYRFGVFVENLIFVNKHNEKAKRGEKTFTVGINKFADLTALEFGQKFNGYKMRTNNATKPLGSKFMAPNNFVAPKSVDWRTKGYVTPVKDQGQCGSCWSFSSTGALEGQHFRKTGKLVSLSEQNLVDCSTKWGNNGCEGGLMDNAFKYVKDNHGIDTEKSYPYKAENLKCHFKKRNVGATDTGFMDVESGSEKALVDAIASVGPVSVAIDASHSSFQLYKEGVYYEPECSSTQLDHGVLAVGYGSDETSGMDYWIVKNSWNTVWGNKGYVWMARNKENNCGVASQASYPLV